jgi:thymidylate synthase
MKQYLDAIHHVMQFGKARGDRTGTGTIDYFGYQTRFNLKDGFPLVTTKFVPIRLVIEELLWFLKGSTNNRELFAKNVHIWDAWALEDRTDYTVIQRRSLLVDQLAVYQAFHDPEFNAVAIPVFETHEELDAWASDFMATHPEASCWPIPKFKTNGRDGDLGPIYGAQWRSWPGRLMTQDITDEEPEPLELDVQGHGFPLSGNSVWQEPIDQIADLVKNLRERPFSRRHVVTAWNPAVLPDESISPQDNVREGRQALASCHCMFQFSVSERDIVDIHAEAGDDVMNQLKAYQETLVEGVDYKGSKLNIDFSNLSMKWLEERGVRTKELSCQLYQRSADMFLGVPFNIASYSLLTMMIAQVVGMVPGEFIWTGGSCHVYSNHFDQIDTQLGRKPYVLPKMVLDPTVKSIDDFTIDSFQLVDYHHHDAIKGKVAV